MHAIILAAGRGGRLEPSGHHAPKCLLEFGGVSLLERHLANLFGLGIEHVEVCVGYRSDLVALALARSPFAERVSTRVNPDFTEGSIVSLWTMRTGLCAGDDVVLMDADVLYAPAILERLVRSAHPNTVLMDRDFLPGDEPVKVCVADGLIVELTKQVPGGLYYDACGESIGFFKLGPEQCGELSHWVAQHLEADRRHLSHEDALRDVILATPTAFGCEDVTGMPWIEIDFPEDIARARDTILPAIDER